MDGVPVKMPDAVSHESSENVRVTIPDFLSTLQSTEYDFYLEKLVLTGLQGGIISQHPPPHSLSSAPGLLTPSCPPYWMMFGSPLDLEPSCQRFALCLEHTTQPTVPDSVNEGTRMARNENTRIQMTVNGTSSHQKAVDVLKPEPTCLSERKNVQQCPTLYDDNQKYLDDDPHADNQDQRPSSQKILNTKSPNKQVSNTNTKRNTGQRLHNPRTMASLRRDSSTELLSVLSLEERELLGTITAQGYPFDTAILALQRTGQHNPDQILSYLVACDHLCQLGYDKAQVEEALEMFQNCETKAEEFLHLLSQFDEMGFQQNAIKEVLLVHENHRERALEELMMRVA